MSARRGPLRVLVVDDDFRVAALHRGLVDDVPGFAVVAVAGTCAQARAAAAGPGGAGRAVDLALVDVHLPDGSGIDLLPELGALGCDTVVVGAENDAAAVRQAFRVGALAYLIKPFETADLVARLTAYARYRRVLDAGSVDQAQLDAAIGALRTGARGRGGPARAGEGGSQTEQQVLALFTDPDVRLFADDVATALGVAAPTARRHLAALVDAGRLVIRLQYGGTGRPRQEYRLA